MSTGIDLETRSYSRATVPSFDRVAVEVLPGSGLVARTPGAVLVLAQPNADAEWRAAESLISLVAEAARAAPRDPGQSLSEAVTTWHAAQPDVGLALLAATHDGLALCLSGTAEAWLPQAGHRLTAQEEGGWLNRQVPWPDSAIVLSIMKPETIDRPRERPVLDLHSGVVPGAGVRLASASTGTATPRDQVQRLDRLPPPPAPPTSAEKASVEPVLSLPPEAKASVLFGADAAVPPRPPLPVVDGPPPTRPPAAGQAAPPDNARAQSEDRGTSAPAAEDGVLVDGFLCSRGHLNDPRGHFCAQCGIRMAELTGILTQGRRPPIGLLLFDTGATFVLDHDYLIGREPESDAAVRSGELRPLTLIDQESGISRQHAEIRLQGWDVVLIDRGSANGTLVALRDAPQWRAVVPGQPIRLLPGMRISMGRRTLSFETPHRTT